jgi:hypothetical protein
MSGTIYFVAGEGCGTVKIGFTGEVGASAALNRMAALQIGSPVKLSLLFCTGGSPRNERAMHRCFASFRSHGEWFKRDGWFAEFLDEFDHDGRFVGPLEFEAKLMFHCGHLDHYNWKDWRAAETEANWHKYPDSRPENAPNSYCRRPRKVSWKREDDGGFAIPVFEVPNLPELAL